MAGKKITAIGTSLGVIIPKYILNKAGLKKGSPIEIDFHSRHRDIRIIPLQSDEIDRNHNFSKEMSRVSSKYASELKKLLQYEQSAD